MVKENKPAEISVFPTAVLFIAIVTLIVVFGGLAWWYWGEDLTADWTVLRQIAMVCFIIWSALLSVLVLSVIAYRLVIRDKVMRDSTPGATKRKKQRYCR